RKVFEFSLKFERPPMSDDKLFISMSDLATRLAPIKYNLSEKNLSCHNQTATYAHAMALMTVPLSHPPRLRRTVPFVS
ncbi:MAG: hypothetical protein N0C90_13795, partial [Candidatus Thiodiazotropha endolucinida]|nr:hypothetical protein [Candidatus Thiodiazotropha taylori]MCW4262436.1 hypothetical protein [Candidatus Thiodiazotropha endolucinida]